MSKSQKNEQAQQPQPQPQTVTPPPQIVTPPQTDLREEEMKMMKESIKVLLDLARSKPPVTPPPAPTPDPVAQKLNSLEETLSRLDREMKTAPAPDSDHKLNAIENKMNNLQDAIRRLVEKDKEEGKEKTWEDILRAARNDSDVSKEEYSRLVLKYAEKRRLEGEMELGETISSTWEAGGWGKAIIITSATGTLMIAGVAWEGFSAAIGWEGGRFLKKFSEWYAAA